MSYNNNADKTEYSLHDLSTEELEALIEAYPGDLEPDDAFLADLMQEYARQMEAPALEAEAKEAQARLMDTLEEKTAQKAKKPHYVARVILIAAVLSVLFVEVVFADGGAFLRSVVQSITRSDWIQTVFGDGIDGAEETVVSYPGKEDQTLPARERVTIDTAEADKVIDDSVKDVSMAVTEGDWTYTIESLIMDENGMGAFTYTIENPNGIGELAESDYDSELIDHPPRAYLTRDGETIPVAVSAYISDEGRTDTWVRLAAYLGVTDGVTDIIDSDDTLTIDFGDGNGMTIVTGEDGTEKPEYVFSALSIPIELKHFAPPITLTADGGWTANVSPVGIRIDQNGAIGDGDYVADEIVLHFSDGSEYVVDGSDPDVINWAYAFSVSDGYSNSGSHRYVFNRVVAPEDITSVTSSGSYQDEQGGHEVALTFTP